MKIAVYNTDNAGCYWYRLYTPLQKIKDKVGGDFDYTFCPPSIDSLIDYDILILQRVTDALGIEMIEFCKEHDIPVVYEIDDSLLNIVGANPASRYYGRADIQYCLKHILKEVDYMTVSTNHLANYYKDYVADSGNIVVLPNSVDLCAPVDKAIIPHSPADFKILLTGGISHKADWAFLEGIIRDLTAESRGKISFTVFGYVPEDFKNILGLRIISPVTVERYFGILSSIDFDLMIAPLEDIEFNYSKSNLKFVEAGALAKPLLGSDVLAYNQDIINEKNGWLLKNNPYWWAKTIRKLASNKDKVKEAGKEAYKLVESKYNLEYNWKLWYDFYNKIITEYKK